MKKSLFVTIFVLMLSGCVSYSHPEPEYYYDDDYSAHEPVQGGSVNVGYYGGQGSHYLDYYYPYSSIDHFYGGHYYEPFSLRFSYWDPFYSFYTSPYYRYPWYAGYYVPYRHYGYSPYYGYRPYYYGSSRDRRHRGGYRDGRGHDNGPGHGNGRGHDRSPGRRGGGNTYRPGRGNADDGRIPGRGMARDDSDRSREPGTNRRRPERPARPEPISASSIAKSPRPVNTARPRISSSNAVVRSSGSGRSSKKAQRTAPVEQMHSRPEASVKNRTRTPSSGSVSTYGTRKPVSPARRPSTSTPRISNTPRATEPRPPARANRSRQAAPRPAQQRSRPAPQRAKPMPQRTQPAPRRSQPAPRPQSAPAPRSQNTRSSKPAKTNSTSNKKGKRNGRDN